MRYAILADIHGNLEAFNAVLEALSGERIDEYLSLGDVAGYGANPRECIGLLRSLKPKTMIAGNHEWGILGLRDTEYFNEPARNAVLWTRNILDKQELEYIKSFALTYEDEKMTLVHGTLNMPEEFYYMFDTDDAYATMSEMKNPICFVGHTHVPVIFLSEDSKIRQLEEDKVRLDYDRKYIVNAGSIGQPRDGNPKASYAIYDDEEAAIEIRRTGYDVKKVQAKILGAGLPASLAYRLAEGR